MRRTGTFEATTVFANAVRRVPVKKKAIQPRTIFTLGEVSVLLRLPDPEKRLGFRDQVLLNLMYASGARAQEICDLKVRDFFKEKNLYKLTITGKGNKTRRIVIASPSGILLERYLIETGRAGQADAYVFTSQTHPQMTISCIEEIYKKYVAIARAENPGMFLEKRYTPAYHAAYNRHAYVRGRDSNDGNQELPRAFLNLYDRTVC